MTWAGHYRLLTGGVPSRKCFPQVGPQFFGGPSLSCSGAEMAYPPPVAQVCYENPNGCLQQAYKLHTVMFSFPRRSFLRPLNSSTSCILFLTVAAFSLVVGLAPLGPIQKYFSQIFVSVMVDSGIYQPQLFYAIAHTNIYIYICVCVHIYIYIYKMRVGVARVRPVN